MDDQAMLFDPADHHVQYPAKGYAATPGTGPAGETCGTCRNCVAVQQANRYYKCELMRKAWTSSRRTDILLRSPACGRWRAKEESK